MRCAARVPVADDALGVEHVQRVVGDAADQQAKLALAVEQRVFILVSFGDVAGDLGEATSCLRRTGRR